MSHSLDGKLKFKRQCGRPGVCLRWESSDGGRCSLNFLFTVLRPFFASDISAFITKAVKEKSRKTKQSCKSLRPACPFRLQSSLSFIKRINLNFSAESWCFVKDEMRRVENKKKCYCVAKRWKRLKDFAVFMSEKLILKYFFCLLELSVNDVRFSKVFRHLSEIQFNLSYAKR